MQTKMQNTVYERGVPTNKQRPNLLQSLPNSHLESLNGKHSEILPNSGNIILQQFTGNMLIDDEYLRGKGLGPEHFLQYRCDPQTEPLRLLADGQTEGEWLATKAAAAGDGVGSVALH